MLPTFIVIGAMKAGTTSLHLYLDEHPQVFMARPKELNFFAEEFNWSEGLDWYEARFEGAAGAQAIGEASPNYSMHPYRDGVPGRMASVIPDAKLVYVVRDPIARIRSHYAHHALRGETVRSIDEEVFASRQYVLASRYAHQIEQYLEHFDADRLV